MAKITISQLQTATTGSIQELTNTEIDTTKGGIALPPLPVDVSGVVFSASDFGLATANTTLSSTQLFVTEGLLTNITLL